MKDGFIPHRWPSRIALGRPLLLSSMPIAFTMSYLLTWSISKSSLLGLVQMLILRVIGWRRLHHVAVGILLHRTKPSALS